MKPGEILIGDKVAEVLAKQAGRVLWISTENIAQIAREAGAPKEKGAGVALRAKLGDSVKVGSVLFEVHAERDGKLEAAMELSSRLQSFVLSRKAEERMLLDQVPVKVARAKSFMLDH